MGVILKTENIEKVYGKGELQVHALKPTNLEIEEGIFYAIIGKSGSGKSTLLHILGGLDKPTGGKLFLEGESVFDLKDAELAVLRRRRIGFVFQAFNLLQEHTVMENILMPIHLDNKDPDMEHFNEAIKSLGIEGKLNYYPDELSGGERQRVAIARALVSKPAIVLADEPTGNLDENTGQEVIRLIKESAKKFNQTIVLVTHDLEIAAEADRVITITNGRISSIEDSNTLQHG
ncbi:ABC transporter ATP-binding protein [Clostridium sp. Cult1]|uniref:ABC transporter ATP-binding protein n=1 Tax=Clostridium sp. Cult1 TaxID=2079002 RepID=UPI001F49059C|nr:ABC transporter ATP-binding protein [Clostridium sp. Cult1]MCF6462446.1 ABC transporter ATP-binding protein [Clostridium sp. Cult1]